MRTIVDIPEDHIKALDAIGADQSLSRTELIRRAVDLYLLEEKKKTSDQAVDKYYGFLKDAPGAFDGLSALEYEQKIRGEWDRRDQNHATWGLHDHAQKPLTGYPEPAADHTDDKENP